MENKKYIDKVIEHLVKGTKIDNEEEIHTPFLFYPVHPFFFSYPFSSSFTKYCKNIYGLTHEEMNYVWEEYRNIIIDDGQ